MTLARVKLWTGPSGVSRWAERIRAAGVPVVCEGTEHVYVNLPMDPEGWGIIPAMEELEQQCKLQDGRLFPAQVLFTFNQEGT